MLRVGLTGGIACGKSLVVRALAARGCRTLDLDQLAHELMRPGAAAYPGVVEEFGPDILAPDGSIDRKRLGARVFCDAAALARLNAIVHPLVRDEEERRVRDLASPGPAAVVVTDAALLIEAGMHLRYDRLVVVHCTPELQLERLMTRDRLGREEALARIASQWPLGEKRSFAHREVDTSRTIEDSEAAAAALAGELGALALRTPAPVAVRPAPDASALGAGLDADGGIDLHEVARLRGAAPGSSWLATGPGDVPVPAGLLPPLIAWCMARRGDDVEYLGGATRSVARALTSNASEVAAVCARAFALQREALGRTASPADATAFGTRWGGASAARA